MQYRNCFRRGVKLECFYQLVDLEQFYIKDLIHAKSEAQDYGKHE